MRKGCWRGRVGKIRPKRYIPADRDGVFPLGSSSDSSEERALGVRRTSGAMNTGIDNDPADESFGPPDAGSCGVSTVRSGGGNDGEDELAVLSNEEEGAKDEGGPCAVVICARTLQWNGERARG